MVHPIVLWEMALGTFAWSKLKYDSDCLFIPMVRKIKQMADFQLLIILLIMEENNHHFQYII